MKTDTPAALALRLGKALKARGMMLATAESCTGGGVAAAITGIAGSSGWFERGFVTYSNEAKQDMLGVSAATLIAYGAVSEQVAVEMATGALLHSGAQVAVAVTGIAGPGGGSADKPVGTVCFAWAQRGAAARVQTRSFTGNRASVRRQSVAAALRGLIALAEK